MGTLLFKKHKICTVLENQTNFKYFHASANIALHRQSREKINIFSKKYVKLEFISITFVHFFMIILHKTLLSMFAMFSFYMYIDTPTSASSWRKSAYGNVTTNIWTGNATPNLGMAP